MAEGTGPFGGHVRWAKGRGADSPEALPCALPIEGGDEVRAEMTWWLASSLPDHLSAIEPPELRGRR